jgi:hypothetical protein
VGMADRCEARTLPADACERYDEHCTEASVEPLEENVSPSDDASCSVARRAQPPHTGGWGLLSVATAIFVGGWRRAAAGQRRRAR